MDVHVDIDSQVVYNFHQIYNADAGNDTLAMIYNEEQTYTICCPLIVYWFVVEA